MSSQTYFPKFISCEDLDNQSEIQRVLEVTGQCKVISVRTWLRSLF